MAQTAIVAHPLRRTRLRAIRLGNRGPLIRCLVRDLETVVSTLTLDRFALLSISQGAAIAIAYAVKHPERVSHLVIYGGYTPATM